MYPFYDWKGSWIKFCDILNLKNLIGESARIKLPSAIFLQILFRRQIYLYTGKSGRISLFFLKKNLFKIFQTFGLFTYILKYKQKNVY